MIEITKYEHACFVVEKEGRSIVIDPGVLTSDYSVHDDVVAIIITHQHADHCDPEHVEAIMESNPTAVIVGPTVVTKKFSMYETRPVEAGHGFALSGFDLDFYGGEHAQIDPSIPTIQNLGVLIEDRIYYPGDSLTIPEKSVDTLLLPISAPWVKISEVFEYMHAINARLVIPTHDAVLSLGGKTIWDGMLKSEVSSTGAIYRRLDGDTIEIE